MRAMQFYPPSRFFKIGTLILSLSFSTLNACADTSPSSQGTFEYKGKVVTYREAAKATSPPDGYNVVDGFENCAEFENIMHVSKRVLSVFLLTENGRNGTVSEVVNSKGQENWDVGYYQVNSINWKSLQTYNITPYDLRWNACINRLAAAKILSPFYEKARRLFIKEVILKKDPLKIMENVTRVLAGYNSQTPKVREVYKNRLLLMILRSLFEGDSTRLW